MIAEIENAIADRLRSASEHGYLGYRLKTVASYAGELDTKDELAKLPAMLPAALVTFQREAFEMDRGQGRSVMRASFAVLVAAGNKRNPTAQRHGGAGEAGAYQIARDALALLADQDLGLGARITRLKPAGVQLFPRARVANLPVTILAVEFQTTYERAGLGDVGTAELPSGLPGGRPLAETMARAAGITDFAAVHADWDAPDGAPVHADHVTLETAP